MTVRITQLPEPAAPPTPDGGLGALRTEKGNLPLDSVDVHAAVTGLAASVTVVQGFRNPFDVPLEATYVFPLPDRAAVTSLRMEAADRVVEGVLKERGQARREYDTAIATGRRAAIAEEDRPDVFTMRVGNILPGERVTVRLALSQPLPYESVAGGSGGEATFRFPLVVAPRYIPGAPLAEEAAGTGVASDTDAVPDASRITPPVLLPGFPNPVALSLAVDVDPGDLPLSEIRSALHVVAEETAGSHTTVRLQPGERLNRDFILRFVFDTAVTGAASLALTPDAQGDEGTFSLTVLPSAEAGHARPRDVVLVLDRSYSMEGWKMVAARRAAARIVDTLTPADRFAVLSFDNLVESPPDLGSGLSDATDRNRFRAVEHLASVNARGGTEMLAPLQRACDLLSGSRSDRDRVLVLVTDGQVGNEDQILNRLSRELRGVRIHTVGIDRAVNAGFLRRLASAGGGHCELVESEDRLDEAMEGVHHRIGAPLLTDLSLRPDGLELVNDTITPLRLGALFPGVPLVVRGRYRGPARGSLTLHGRTPSGSPREYRARAVVTDAPMASALWARAHLRDLEDRYAAGGSASLEQDIVDTSLTFGVLCRFTAFVAVDSRVVTDGQEPHQVTQPVDVPDGWAGATAPAEAYGASVMSLPYADSASASAFPAAPGAPSGPPPPPRMAPAAPLRGSSRSAPPPHMDVYASASAAEDDDVPDFLTAGPPPSAPKPAPAPPSPSEPAPPSAPPSGPTPRRRARPASSGRTSIEVARHLRAELDRMKTVQDTDRASHLETQLLPFLTWLLSSGLVLTPPVRASLDDLAQKIRALIQPTTEFPSPSPTDIWEEAITTLQDLTTNTPAPRTPFWKRPQ
ncbi:VWA domain-containing protein [Actinomadura logoneensis]|uniref:VWA domain-containing protein n=1 Tax=Actinomadura logoneensis TaxID=2293572 RepID=A0A372JS37_9ACTN|nr:VIT domain-containing protein [Actinomadura logoneensis]RFU42168.1 VWA domain-containing protein [Actinomadura logoneensis]